MLAEHGIQHVRTHVDVTDPTLAALRAMIEVREEARHLIDLQIVAFPQEGIESYAGGRELMTLAVELGADVVGGIPHFENTRDQGVSSIKFLMDLAERTGCLVDSKDQQLAAISAKAIKEVRYHLRFSRCCWSSFSLWWAASLARCGAQIKKVPAAGCWYGGWRCVPVPA